LHISSFTTHQQNFGNFWMCGPEPQGLLWLEDPQDRATPFAVVLTHAPFTGRRSPGGCRCRSRERVVLVGVVGPGLDRVHRVGVEDRTRDQIERGLAGQGVHPGDVDLQVVVREVVPAEGADGPRTGAPLLEVGDLGLDHALLGREVVLAADHDRHGVLEGLVQARHGLLGVGLDDGAEQLALVEVVARAVATTDGVLEDLVDGVGVALRDLRCAGRLGRAVVQLGDGTGVERAEVTLQLVSVAGHTLRDEHQEGEQ